LRGFQEKCSSFLQKQTPAYSGVRHGWIFKRDRILWSDETKKRGFLAANPADVFGAKSANRDEEYPMPTVKYTAGSCMLWAYLFAGGPGHLVPIHGIMDSIKYKEIKNKNLTPSARNYNGPWLDLPSGQRSKTKIKSTQKLVTEHKMKLLP